MPKTHRAYAELKETAKRTRLQNLLARAEDERRNALERNDGVNNRIEENADANRDMGGIVLEGPGEAEVDNEEGRRAASPNINQHHVQQEDRGEINEPRANQAPERNEAPRIFAEEEEPVNPYDEEDNSEDDFSDGEGRYDQYDDWGNEDLYHGSPITVTESMVMVLHLMLSHNLTGSCVEDLLQVINLHCPRNGFRRLSYYKFRKFFHSSKVPMKKKFYCSVCFTGLRTRNEVCPTCRQDNEKAYFVQLPLIPQLGEMYKRRSFYNSLQHRHNRIRGAGPNYLEDIYDGSVYQEQVRSGFLSNRNNISLTWYTDGAPVFTSKNYSIWPFSFMINELPYKMRTSRENFLLAGLWFGPHKPAVNLFLRSFLPDLRKLHEGHGFNVEDLNGRQAVVKAIVLAGVADVPAKSSFFNFNGHTGFYGCTACEIEGETLRRNNETDKHVYRYHQAPPPLRSIIHYEILARRAIGSTDPVLGIRGPTVLHLFMPDFLKGAAIDPMHLVTGVTKKLLGLHFGKEHARPGTTIRDSMKVADQYLLAMQPPQFVHRKPQSLLEYHRWKASQVDAWLKYYSIPIYEQLLPGNLFHHYLKFVAAISLLNADKVSVSMIDRAENLLNEFVKDFETLYDLQFCSINIHLLLHLPDCVRRLGPLWVYTCYPMENLNGLMLANIHGKTSVDSQVCKAFWQVLCHHRLRLTLAEGEVKEFITRRRRSVKIQDRIAAGCYTVGDYTNEGANDPNLLRVLRGAQINAGHVVLYFRLLKDRLIYVAERYTRALASKSSYVMYEVGGNMCYGSVEVFLRSQCNCNEPVCRCDTGHFAVIRGVELIQNFAIPFHPNSPLTHIHKFRESDRTHVVPVSWLKTVCFYMNVEGSIYIGKPINSYEVE